MLPFINKLVNFLEGLFTTEEELSHPVYLTDSAVDFPDTATEAVRNETLRVWDNSINLLSSVFGFKRTEILSDMDLYELANSQKKLIEYDIDPDYEKNIKFLYGEIVVFISKAGFSWEMEQSGHIHWLRKANQNMVDAIKDSKHLQKNLVGYSMSSNPQIHDAYTKIRVELSLLLRKLEFIRQQSKRHQSLVALDDLKLMLDEHVLQMNQWMANCIKQELITPEMATSLMNDVSYATDIFRNLLQMGDTLFINHSHQLSEAEQDIALDEDDFDNLQKEMGNA